MYQKTIIKSLIVNSDMQAYSLLLLKQDFTLSDKNINAIFEIIKQYAIKFNALPSVDYLNEYFKGEYEGNHKDAFNEIFNNAEVSVISNVSSLIGNQLDYFIKVKNQQILKEYLTNFKVANNSQIAQISNDLLNELYTINKAIQVTDVRSEGIIYHDSTKQDAQNEIQQRLISDYDLRKSGRVGYYQFNTGFFSIDNVIGGIHNVEFMGIMGYVKNGKSYFVRQIAYNVLLQKRNVLFITLEMSYESILLSFLALHANNVDIFGVDATKIRIADIRNARLTNEAEDFFKNKVINDFTTNANLGSLYIKQPTETKYTPQSLFADVKYIQNSVMDIDLIVIDYPALMTPSSNRRDRDSYNELYRELRHFSLINYIPIIFVLQANRQGYLKALSDKDKLYSIDAIGDFNSIEKECSNVLSIITTNEMRDLGKSQIQHILSRESSLFKPFTIYTDFECGLMCETENYNSESYKELLKILV